MKNGFFTPYNGGEVIKYIKEVKLYGGKWNFTSTA